MIIESVSPVSYLRVETDEPVFNVYERYSSNCWYVHMGESTEPVNDYDCEKLEAEFQKYISKKKGG